MTNIETSSKESTSELVNGGPVPLHWDATNADVKGHDGAV